MKPRKDIAEFLLSVDRSAGSKKCWLWLGSIASGGYGRLGCRSYGLDHYYELAHRLSYILFKGPIPKGAYVCHKCDNPPCVNPSHLYLGDAKANNKDRAAKGRNANRVGEHNTGAKLTEDIVRHIIESPEQGKVLAKRFDLSESTVSQIRSGKLWPHVMADRPTESSNRNLRRFFNGRKPTIEGIDMAKRYRAGESRDQLAEAYETTPNTITNTLKAMRIQRRDGGAPKRPLRLEGKEYPGVLAAMRETNHGYAYVTQHAEFL